MMARRFTFATAVSMMLLIVLLTALIWSRDGSIQVAFARGGRFRLVSLSGGLLTFGWMNCWPRDEGAIVTTRWIAMPAATHAQLTFHRTPLYESRNGIGTVQVNRRPNLDPWGHRAPQTPAPFSQVGVSLLIFVELTAVLPVAWLITHWRRRRSGGRGFEVRNA
jgi:hypothetical protein